MGCPTSQYTCQGVGKHLDPAFVLFSLFSSVGIPVLTGSWTGVFLSLMCISPMCMPTYRGLLQRSSKSCLTLATPWTVVHQAPFLLSMGFFQASTLEVAISSSRRSSRARDGTHVSVSSKADLKSQCFSLFFQEFTHTSLWKLSYCFCPSFPG